jgi:membrane associated rhomboid family serine protease
VDQPLSPAEQTADRIVDRLSSPWMTGVLVASVVGVHVAVGWIPYARGRTDLLGVLIRLRGPRLLERCGAMHGESLDQGELWRLISASFLHVEGIHLLLNAVALFVLGRLCEAVFGSVRLLWLFLVAGAGGAALSWFAGNPLSVGASSAVFGLMGAAIVFGWRHGADLPARARSFFRWKLLPWLALNLALGLLPFIDAYGHLGGLIAGSALTLVLGNRVVPGNDGVRWTRGLMGSACIGLLVAGVWGVWTQWAGALSG